MPLMSKTYPPEKLIGLYGMRSKGELQVPNCKTYWVKISTTYSVYKVYVYLYIIEEAV